MHVNHLVQRSYFTFQNYQFYMYLQADVEVTPHGPRNLIRNDEMWCLHDELLFPGHCQCDK